MNRTKVKQLLRASGFTGSIHFRKHTEFGTPDSFGSAIHRRWIGSGNCDEINYRQDRDGFEAVVIYLEPKSYYETVARLHNPKHVWLEGQINGLRRNLGYCTNWSQAAAEQLRDDIRRMNFPAFKISKEQTKFGLEWLKRTQFKLNGELRANAFITENEANIIKNFARFEFVGLRFDAVNPYTNAPQAVLPIYRTIARNKKSFTYVVNPMGWGRMPKYEVVGA